MNEDRQEKSSDQPPSVTVRPPSPENLWAELAIAFNYLTRFNLPLKEDPQSKLIGKAMGWFPLRRRDGWFVRRGD